MYCRHCGTKLDEEVRFCGHCGEPVESKPSASFCSQCGSPLKPDSHFCAKCGTKRKTPAEEPAKTDVPISEAERPSTEPPPTSLETAIRSSLAGPSPVKPSAPLISSSGKRRILVPVLFALGLMLALVGAFIGMFLSPDGIVDKEPPLLAAVPGAFLIGLGGILLFPRRGFRVSLTLAAAWSLLAVLAHGLCQILGHRPPFAIFVITLMSLCNVAGNLAGLGLRRGGHSDPSQPVPRWLRTAVAVAFAVALAGGTTSLLRTNPFAPATDRSVSASAEPSWESFASRLAPEKPSIPDALRSLGPLVGPRFAGTTKVGPEGKTIQLDDNARIEVPPGAFPSPVRLRVDATDLALSLALPESGDARAYTLSTVDDVPELGQPVILEIPYPAEALRVVEMVGDECRPLEIKPGSATRVEFHHFSVHTVLVQMIRSGKSPLLLLAKALSVPSDWLRARLEHDAALKKAYNRSLRTLGGSLNPREQLDERFNADMVNGKYPNARIFSGMDERAKRSHQAMYDDIARMVLSYEGRPEPNSCWIMPEDCPGVLPTNWQEFRRGVLNTPLGEFFNASSLPSQMTGNWFWNRVSRSLPTVRTHLLRTDMPPQSVTLARYLQSCIEAQNPPNIPLGVLAAHNLLKDVAYRWREKMMWPKGAGDVSLEDAMVVSKFEPWRADPRVKASRVYDKAGPLYHFFAPACVVVFGSPLMGEGGLSYESLLRNFGCDASDPEKLAADTYGRDLGYLIYERLKSGKLKPDDLSQAKRLVLLGAWVNSEQVEVNERLAFDYMYRVEGLATNETIALDRTVNVTGPDPKGFPKAKDQASRGANVPKGRLTMAFAKPGKYEIEYRIAGLADPPLLLTGKVPFWVIDRAAKKIVLVQANVVPQAPAKIGGEVALDLTYRVEGIEPDEEVSSLRNVRISGPLKMPFPQQADAVKKGAEEVKARLTARLGKAGGYTWEYYVEAPGYDTLSGRVPFVVGTGPKAAEPPPATPPAVTERIYVHDYTSIWTRPIDSLGEVEACFPSATSRSPMKVGPGQTSFPFGFTGRNADAAWNEGPVAVTGAVSLSGVPARFKQGEEPTVKASVSLGGGWAVVHGDTLKGQFVKPDVEECVVESWYCGSEEATLSFNAEIRSCPKTWNRRTSMEIHGKFHYTAFPSNQIPENPRPPDAVEKLELPQEMDAKAKGLADLAEGAKKESRSSATGTAAGGAGGGAAARSAPSVAGGQPSAGRSADGGASPAGGAARTTVSGPATPDQMLASPSPWQFREVQALMDEWLRVSKPVGSSGGVWRWTEWGQATDERTVRAAGPPDHGTQPRYQYLWNLASKLQSAQHGTLREYIERRLKGLPVEAKAPPAGDSTTITVNLNDPRSLAVAQNTLGNALFERKDWAAAEKSYREAARMDPENGMYRANLAGALYNQGRKDEAVKEARESMRLGVNAKDHWLCQQVAAAAAAPSEPARVVEVTDANWNAEVMQSKRPVLILYWMAGDAAAKKQMQIFDELMPRHAGSVKFARVNVNRAPGASRGINGSPTLRLYRDGALVKETAGLQGKEAVQQILTGTVENRGTSDDLRLLDQEAR